MTTEDIDALINASETNSYNLFLKVIRGELPSEQVYSDDKVVVFKDINPQAPVHLLLVPRVYIQNLFDLTEQHDELIAHMIRLLPKIAQEQGLDNGFRTVINTGKGGGQIVHHLHIHLLGGKNFSA